MKACQAPNREIVKAFNSLFCFRNIVLLWKRPEPEPDSSRTAFLFDSHKEWL